MEVTLRNDVPSPSQRAIAFLKLFARNYKEVELANGEFARMILK